MRDRAPGPPAGRTALVTGARTLAEFAALLYGPASASITGSSLTQDGGWSAR